MLALKLFKAREQIKFEHLIFRLLLFLGSLSLYLRWVICFLTYFICIELWTLYFRSSKQIEFYVLICWWWSLVGWWLYWLTKRRKHNAWRFNNLMRSIFERNYFLLLIYCLCPSGIICCEQLSLTFCKFASTFRVNLLDNVEALCQVEFGLLL